MRICPVNNFQSSNNCAFGAKVSPENVMELYKNIRNQGLGSDVLKTSLQKIESKGLKSTLIAIGAAKIYQDHVSASTSYGDFVDYSAHTGRSYEITNPLFGDEKVQGVVHMMNVQTELQGDENVEMPSAPNVDIETVVDEIDIDKQELQMFKSYMEKQAPGMAVVKLKSMLGNLFSEGIDDKKLQKMLYIAQGVDLKSRQQMDIQANKAYEEIQSYISK